MVATSLETGPEAGLGEGEEAALRAGRSVRRVGEGVAAGPLALGAMSSLGLHSVRKEVQWVIL